MTSRRQGSFNGERKQTVDPGARPPGGRRREGPIRVALIEDHHLVREGLKLVLSRHDDLAIVGEGVDAQDALAVLENDPEVLLLDITLPSGDALSLIGILQARRPSLRVVILSMHSDPETVRQALLAGARGYIVKGAYASELVDAIHAVMRGERYIHSSVAGAVIDDSIRWLRKGAELTVREREILSLVASGNSSRTIGRSLGISIHTVRRHLANMKAKLGVQGIAGLTRYAAEHGLIRQND